MIGTNFNMSSAIYSVTRDSYRSWQGAPCHSRCPLPGNYKQ